MPAYRLPSAACTDLPWLPGRVRIKTPSLCSVKIICFPKNNRADLKTVLAISGRGGKNPLRSPQQMDACETFKQARRTPKPAWQPPDDHSGVTPYQPRTPVRNPLGEPKTPQEVMGPHRQQEERGGDTEMPPTLHPLVWQPRGAHPYPMPLAFRQPRSPRLLGDGGTNPVPSAAREQEIKL